MQSIFKKVKDSILGGSQEEKSESLVTADQDIEASHAAHTANGGQSASEGPTAGSRTVAGKRTREEGDLEEARGTTKRRTSSNEISRRLTPFYDTPSNAKPIAFPTYESIFAPQQPTTKSAPEMGGYQPMNTLNAQPHAAGRGTGTGRRVGTPRPSANRRGQAATTAQNVSLAHLLELQGSKGSNVRDQVQNDSTAGDGFNNAPSAKRRKTEHPNGTNEKLKGGLVDLTAGDEDEMRLLNAKVKGASGLNSSDFRKPTVPTRKGVAARKDEDEDYFGGNNYVAKMNKTLNPQAPNSRRAKGDSQLASRSSQQPATRSPSVMSQADPRVAASQPGSRQSPVQIDEREGSVKSAARGEASKPAQRRTIPQSDPGPSGTSNRPPINLTKGFDEIEQAQVRPSGKKDIVNAGNALLRNKLKQHDAEQATERQLHAGLDADGQKLKSAGSVGAGTLGAAAQAREQTKTSRQTPKRQASPPSLAQTFQRDVSNASQAQPQTKRIKRTVAMQAESRKPQPNTSPMDDSMDSIDPLQGEATVPSKAGRAVSPINYSPMEARAASPSDLKPTNFKQSSAAKLNSEGPQNFSDASEEEDPEANERTVVAFYAASFCASAGGTDKALIYSEHAQGLELHVGGQPARFANSQPVTLDLRNVSKISYAPDCGCVFLKGSKWGVSNGAMCIAFTDYNGVGWFISMMSSLSNAPSLALTIDRCALGQLERTFSHQAKQLQAAFDLKRHAPPSELYKETPRLKSPDEDDEQIRYELEEEETVDRPNRRKAMQGGDQIDIHATQRNKRLASRQTGFTSDYFQKSSAVRRSTRERKPVVERASTPTPERWTQIHGLPTWNKPVEYPAKGMRRVTVDVKDLEVLDEGQFLNDNIISFALRKIEEDIAPKYRDQVHFFNSFFYTSMSTKNGKKVFNYEGVKKWTKNKDLFAMPFVVVPINIDLHWILAIVCNLDKMGKKAVEDVPTQQDHAEPDAVAEGDQQDNSVVVVAKGDDEQPAKEEEAAMNRLSLSDNDDHEKDDSPGEIFDFGEDGKITSQDGEDEPTSSRPGTANKAKKVGKGKRKSIPPIRAFPPDAPTIILLDSFGNNHPRESGNLKDYVVAEAKDKRDLDIEQKDIQGVNAKGLPQQSNFCDCGVFLIGYVEAFAADPRGFVERIMSRKLDKGQDFKGWSPAAKRAAMREDLIKLYAEQEVARREVKRAKAHAGTAKAGVLAAHGGDQVATTLAGSASKDPTPKATPSASKASTPARELAKSEAAVKPTNNTAIPTSKSNSAEPQAARQKTPLSTKATALAKPLGQNHGIKGDVHDELESEAPRPLQVQRTAAITHRQGDDFNGSISGADDENDRDDHDDDDMLDKGPAREAEMNAAPEATTESDLFSSRKEQLHKEKEQLCKDKEAVALQGSMKTKTKAVPPHRKQRWLSKQPKQQPAVIVVEDDSQRSAVVPDSQEAASGVWAGKKTVLAD